MITLLAIKWATVGIQVAQLLLALSILVVLHEFGHYITAKWFGCRVEKFYLFFDPWFSVVKKKVGETEYGIGWLPLGGYVKISGMIDESMDKEAMKLPPKPYEFRSKPAWQRLIIMLGGVIMNVLVAFVIYAMVLYTWGDSKVKYDATKDTIAINDCLMYEIGFRNGDKVLTVNGDSIHYENELNREILLGKTANVERDGKVVTLNFPVALLGKLIEKKKGSKMGATLIDVRRPAIAGEFNTKDTTSGAMVAGIKKFDKIVSVNNYPVQYQDQIKIAILKVKRKDTAFVKVVRGADTLAVAVKLSEDWRLGLPPLSGNEMDSLHYLNIVKKEYGFFSAFPAGVQRTGEQLVFYVRQFKKILSPETGAYKGVGGFRNMGRLFTAEWDWYYFWNITALLSVILAFMNLLPIPGLDGGHVVFTLFEMITGKKPGEKFLEKAQIFGMVILFGLMIYANGNDWLGWGKSKPDAKPQDQECHLSYNP